MQSEYAALQLCKRTRLVHTSVYMRSSHLEILALCTAAAFTCSLFCFAFARSRSRSLLSIYLSTPYMHALLRCLHCRGKGETAVGDGEEEDEDEEEAGEEIVL
jgi:hypothetical protein